MRGNNGLPCIRVLTDHDAVEATATPKRILYIEDDEDTLDIVSLTLTRSNYEIISADTYHEGLSLANQSAFDLYIIDHILTDGSGIDLCRKIRRFDTKTPIIVCSGKRTISTSKLLWIA